MKTDLLIYNAKLVTCASNGKPKRLAEMQNVGLVENGTVAVKDGKIVAVGKSDEIFRTSAISSVVKPPKYFNSTI